MKIRKNDTVIVTTGKDSGRQGIVEKVSLSQGTVLVSGINQ